MSFAATKAKPSQPFLAGMRICAFCSVLLPLAACSNFTNRTAGVDANGCDAPDKATGVRLELVAQQMAAGQYHAALAHLDTIDGGLPQAQLLRARASRAIHDPDAAASSYRALLDTCLAAYAHQGLGIVAADRRDLAEALSQLKLARQQAPVDAEIRNDYGFALLAAGRIEAALRELRTAVELDAGNAVATRNLMLTLFVAKHDDEARALGQSHAFADNEIDTLAARARNYRPLAVMSAEKPLAQAAKPVPSRIGPRVAMTTAKAADVDALVDIPVNPHPVITPQESAANGTR